MSTPILLTMEVKGASVCRMSQNNFALVINVMPQRLSMKVKLYCAWNIALTYQEEANTNEQKCAHNAVLTSRWLSSIVCSGRLLPPVLSASASPET